MKLAKGDLIEISDLDDLQQNDGLVVGDLGVYLRTGKGIPSGIFVKIFKDPANIHERFLYYHEFIKLPEKP